MGNVTFSSPCSSNEGILIHDPSIYEYLTSCSCISSPKVVGLASHDVPALKNHIR